MELIEFQGVGDQEDVQQLLNNYDIEKLSEALNTVASTDTTRERAKVKFRDKFMSENQNNKSALARL